MLCSPGTLALGSRATMTSRRARFSRTTRTSTRSAPTFTSARSGLYFRLLPECYRSGHRFCVSSTGYVNLTQSSCTILTGIHGGKCSVFHLSTPKIQRSELNSVMSAEAEMPTFPYQPDHVQKGRLHFERGDLPSFHCSVFHDRRQFWFVNQTLSFTPWIVPRSQGQPRGWQRLYCALPSV